MRSWQANRIVVVVLAGLLGTWGIQVANGQSIWQKIKDSAKQTGQNTAQQGAQQVQQGMQGAVGNQMNGTQQTPCGSFGNSAGAPAGTLTNASYNGGGGANGNVANGSCGQNCFNAGPFAAAISQMTMSQQGYWHLIRMEIQFHNATNQSMALAYHEGSMEMVDELGNAYQGAGGNPGELQGMGIDRGAQTDSQFVLAPGQTSSAMFTVARARNNTQAIGTSFNYNFTIDELQAQNGAQAIVARQYNLNFPNLAPGFAGGAFPSGANGFVGETGNGAAGVANYAGASSGSGNNALTGNARAAVPSQRGMVTTRPGMAATAATPNPGSPAARPVNNAALRSTAVTAAKPAAAVKAIPTKNSTTKTAAKTNTDSK